MTGFIARHGGHQEAQKSTSTGSLDWSTSFFQLNSWSSMAFSPWLIARRLPVLILRRLRRFRCTQLLQVRFLFGKHVREDNDEHFQGFLLVEAGVVPKVL